MDIKDVLMWIFRIFMAVPWWLKIIIVLIVLGIINFIGEIICKPFDIISGKRKSQQSKKITAKISATIKSDPEAAFRTAVENQKSGAISHLQYGDLLTEIAEKTGHLGAMVKLTELYHGEVLQSLMDRDKYYHWLERAAKAGHIASIVEYYKFSDYDVSSKAYEEMAHALDQVKPQSKVETDEVEYRKGIVQYKLGNINAAKQLFAQSVSEEYGQRREYMLLQCAIKDADVPTAEKLLKKLEKNGFQVSANNYLYIYDYYVSIRETPDRDYESEIKYAEKYAICQDNDPDTANRIVGDSYYNLGKALQDENEAKSLEAYKKAADCGNPDALYHLGRCYWLGLQPRNYYQAIQYLGKAAQGGHKQAKQILSQYGFEGILIKSTQTEKTDYHFLDGHMLTASARTLQWMQMYYGIKYQGIFLASTFERNYFDTFKSFNQMVNGVHQLYADYVAYMLQWCIRLLMFFNIDAYVAEDIIERCEDLSLLPRVPQFEQSLEQIDYRAREMNAQMYYAKSTRGVWSGSGFGTTLSSTIKATVKANVAAGVMNIGSGLLHGIGDGIVKSTNNAELKKMGDRLFANPETVKEFKNAVLSACTEIAAEVMTILENHCGMGLDSLEGAIVWKGEPLSEIDDRALSAKINNNLAVENNEYVYALLLENLRRNPLDADVFQKIFELTVRLGGDDVNKAHKACLQYAGDFNLRLTDLQRTWASRMLATRTS